MQYFVKDESMVGRKIVDELILIPVKQNVAEINSIYSLNELGARIWELLNDHTTLEAIVSVVTKEYKVEVEQAEADIKEFLEHLVEIGAITLKDNNSPDGD